MNRADIRNLVIDHTGRPDKVSLINSMITSALKKISSEMHWGDLLTETSVTLIPNQEFIAIGSNIHRITMVRIIDGLSSWELEVHSKKWILERWPDLASQFFSRPRFAYLENSRIYMVPGPSEDWVLKFSFYKRAADLSDDSTELFPEHIDEAVIAYATYRTFKSLQMHEDAIVWFADYREMIRDAKKMDHDSVVTHQGTPRGQGRPIAGNYYLDPFIRRVP